MMSTEGFFYLQEREVYYEHTVENKVASLPSLTFCENLLIVQEKKNSFSTITGVRIMRIEFYRKKLRAFPQGQRKLSVYKIILTRCRGVRLYLHKQPTEAEP